MFSTYIKILRIQNAAMATGAVFLGAWIAHSPHPWYQTALLALAALLATGYGNVINDIFDIETDRISHPDRPLPKGLISPGTAKRYAAALAAGALASAYSVGILYGSATLIPLSLLTVYAFFLKRTPLAGNILVSLLVAYSLVFGALEAPQLLRLVIPALLAMLLNITREIIKDVQDEEGDRAAGMATTAALPRTALVTLIYSSSSIYLLLLFTPTIAGICTPVYAIAVAATALPIHGIRLYLLIKYKLTAQLPRMSQLVKIEMLCGLAALTLDRILR